MREHINQLVKDGYDSVAIQYREEKDKILLKNPLFLKWLSLLNYEPVLDLGCGSGFPVLESLPKKTKYLGIDLSSTQIELARKQYPHRNFCIAEMLNYLRKQLDDSFGGVLSLFSIFHIHRDLHREFISQIRRISEFNAPLLLQVPESATHGSEDDFFGVNMWWSNFSFDWYIQVLKEIGFSVVDSFREEATFSGEREINWYLLALA